MTDQTLIADLIRAGVSPELVQRVVQQLVEAGSGVSASIVRDEAAERRRAWDRQRKASLKSNSTGIPPESTGIQESQNPSLSLTPSPQVSPKPPSSPTPTLPLTPVREASKPSASAPPPPGDGSPSKPQTPKPSKPQPAADPRHAEFVRIFADEYQEATGRPYAMQGGKDGQQLQNLLRTLKDLDAEEWRQGLRWSWKVSTSDQYANACVRQTGSLAAFCTAWSRIVAYHATYQPSNR